MRGTKAKALRRLAGLNGQPSELHPIMYPVPRVWVRYLPTLARLISRWRNKLTARLLLRRQETGTLIQGNPERWSYKWLKSMTKKVVFIEGPRQYRVVDGKVVVHRKKTGRKRALTTNELRRMIT